jgi:hypothetical protein
VPTTPPKCRRFSACYRSDSADRLDARRHVAALCDRSHRRRGGVGFMPEPYRELEQQLRPLADPLPPPRPGDWLTEYYEPGQTFAEYLEAHPVRRSDKLRTIYLCLVGEFSGRPPWPPSRHGPGTPTLPGASRAGQPLSLMAAPCRARGVSHPAHRRGRVTSGLETSAAVVEKPKWRAKRTERQRAYQPWRALSRMRRGRVASMPVLHEGFIGSAVLRLTWNNW